VLRITVEELDMVSKFKNKIKFNGNKLNHVRARILFS
jgi:hypothetical protein